MSRRICLTAYLSTGLFLSMACHPARQSVNNEEYTAFKIVTLANRLSSIIANLCPMGWDCFIF